MAGDPAALPHPIVWFGRLIAVGERLLNRGRGRFVKGLLLTVSLVAGVFALTVSLLRAAERVDLWLLVAVQSALVFYFLAGTTLVREVRGVFSALDSSLAEGRRQVSRIVGRDTQELDADDVRRAALETLAENLSDGVIAPMFWFLLLGVPGMAAYKMTNTLDSMIGYRTVRYKSFGCAAARLDDALNYVPARLTALLMCVAAGRLPVLSFVARNGRNHASPNSGYPEAALAGILGCRFGGGHYYFGEYVPKPYIGDCGRRLTGDDLHKAICVNRGAELLMLLLCLFATLLPQALPAVLPSL